MAKPMFQARFCQLPSDQQNCFFIKLSNLSRVDKPTIPHEQRSGRQFAAGPSPAVARVYASDAFQRVYLKPAESLLLFGLTGVLSD
jgi:hypothetical protein